MSRKPREAIVFLLDVGHNMNQLSDDFRTTHFESSKECICQIIQRKIFSTSRDELALITFGSEETDNTLASDNEYRNIVVVTKDLQAPNWNLLKQVHMLSCSYNSSADWLDAIVVAMEFMRDKTAGFQSIYHYKIVLFSNFECPVLEAHVSAISAGMKDSNISLVVIGPDVSKTEYSAGKSKSVHQKVGENLISKIVEDVDGVICSFQEAFPELMYFQRKSVKPTPWNALFTVSEKIKIPVQMFKKITEPSFRKWLSKVIDDDEAGVVKERAYVKFDEDRETEVEVPKYDVINAYQFGSTVVPFSDIDKESMRYETGEKGLFFIGCTKRERVPMHLLVGDGSYVVLTRPEDNVAKVALEAFIQALFERNCVGVARRIYNKNTATTIGALFPVVTDVSKYLVFAQLPFAEDEHLYKFPSLANVIPTDEQSKSVDDLIEMMDLDTSDTEPEKYDITRIYDHNEQYVFKCLGHKALYPEQLLPDELAEIGPSIKADPKMIEACQGQLTRIKNLFPLEEVPEKPKRRGFNRIGKNDDDEPQSTNLFKNYSISDSTECNREFISSLHYKLPVDEFKKIKSDVEEIISSSNLASSKILTTLKFISKICSDCPKVYNQWIENLKDQFCQTDRTNIWEKIVEEKLNGIQDNVILNTGVANKAAELHNQQDEEADSMYGTQTADDIDDLFDNI